LCYAADRRRSPFGAVRPGGLEARGFARLESFAFARTVRSTSVPSGLCFFQKLWVARQSVFFRLKNSRLSPTDKLRGIT
ncbi:MAG: hypothetical protein AAGM46_16230, partial [Cyanobacteria bacterium J06582_2]